MINRIFVLIFLSTMSLEACCPFLKKDKNHKKTAQYNYSRVPSFTVKSAEAAKQNIPGDTAVLYDMGKGLKRVRARGEKINKTLGISANTETKL